MNGRLRVVVVRMWFVQTVATTTVALAELGARAEWPEWLTITAIGVALMVNTAFMMLIEEQMEEPK